MDTNVGREDKEMEIGLLTLSRNTPSPTCSFSPYPIPKRPSPKPNNPLIPVVISTQSAEITPVTHDNIVQPTIIKQEPISSLHPTEENPDTINKVCNPPITGSTGSDKNGLYFSWVDRVTLVGFNDDGISVDKMVNERNVWDNQYNTDRPTNRPSVPPPNGPSDESQLPPNPDNLAPQQQRNDHMMVASGGPPNDPSDPVLHSFSAQACNDQKDHLRPLHNKDCSEPELAVKLVSV
ncbi:hypothetical protein EV360DRAFT_88557 [Lentinula raphanica]|nr:hypothetical protein EV360DRAFT_88557 [Lentinula raphanica]